MKSIYPRKNVLVTTDKSPYQTVYRTVYFNKELGSYVIIDGEKKPVLYNITKNRAKLVSEWLKERR